MAKKALQAKQQVLKDLEDQAAARLRPWSHHICLYNSIYWLVVWNIFHILGIIIPTDSYFSGRLKPPIRILYMYTVISLCICLYAC